MKSLSLLLAATLLGSSCAFAANYSGNGNTGFGGVVSSLDVTDDGTNITFTLNRGPGGLNDSLVIYLDSVVGGSSSTGNFTDTGDPLRKALSGRDGGSNSSVVTFPSGFGADYGIALDGGFAGVWALVENGLHNFTATANGAPGGSVQASYALTTTLASLGLSAGSTVSFVATYLNSGNSYRSNEGVGDGLPGSNVGQAPVSFTAARSYTVVPETSAASLLISSLLLLGTARRRSVRR